MSSTVKNEAGIKAETKFVIKALDSDGDTIGYVVGWVGGTPMMGEHVAFAKRYDTQDEAEGYAGAARGITERNFVVDEIVIDNYASVTLGGDKELCDAVVVEYTKGDTNYNLMVRANQEEVNISIPMEAGELLIQVLNQFKPK